MELFFLALLIIIMAWALGSGYPVAFALPGAAIVTIVLAALAGWLFAGSTDAYFAQGGPEQWLRAGVTNLRGVYWEVERDTLIAIPLFIFMGIMLQRSKIAEDLLVTMAQLFGPVRGGLGISVVFVGALLAATTGIVGATVVAMGLISLPAMMRNNYSNSLATGTIAASGTLGQIIPPSIVLIILADQLASATDQASTGRKLLYKENTGELTMPSAFEVSSTSAGEMFLGALIPGLVLVGLYMAYILIYALIKPDVAPAVHRDGGFDKGFYGKLALALIPPLTLIVLVLGSIISGVATVNQAGAIGAAGALIMAGYRLYEGRRHCYTPAIIALISLVVIGIVINNFDTNIRGFGGASSTPGIVIAFIATVTLSISLVWSGLRAYRIDNTLTGVMIETAKTTSLVFIILLGAAMLTAAFRAFGGEELVKEFLTGLPGGFWMQFVIVMAVIFVLGFFLDFIEIAVVVVPIVAPILLLDPGANITAVWLGVMIGLNIQTSFLTPPFGFALFYLRGVAPSAVKTVQMYRGVVAFIALQLAALGIVGYFPPLVNYLPNRVSLASPTAPPPINPRLQSCIESYVFRVYSNNGDKLTGAIANVRKLDLSYVPGKETKALEKAFDNADKVFVSLKTIEAAEVAVDAATPDYRPLHVRVRRIESDMRKLDHEIGEIRQQLNNLKRQAPDSPKISRMTKQIEALEEEKRELAKQIPESWDQRRKEFVKLKKEQHKARQGYRRSADSAYEPIVDMIDRLRQTSKLTDLRGPLTGLADVITNSEPDAAADRIKEVSRMLREAEAASAIRSALGKARRKVRGRNIDKEKAQEELNTAIALYEEGAAWRERAVKDLLPGLEAYEAAIGDTIGLRKQKRLPIAQVPEIAGCIAKHRNISLDF